MTAPPVTGPSRRAVYTGRTTSWPMVAATCVGAIVLALTSGGPDGTRSDLYVVFLLVVIGCLAEVLTASSVRATAGPNGLTIRWGVLGWPHCTYRLDEIEHAQVIDLPWWRVSWGFWWTLRRTNCTVRSGPTIQLLLRNHRTVVMTVPDPAAAVAALHEAEALRRGDPVPG